MFRIKNLTALCVLRELFTKSRDVHDYNTRQKDIFQVPNATQNYLQRINDYKDIIIWKHISKYVAHDCSRVSFKLSFKLHIWCAFMKSLCVTRVEAGASHKTQQHAGMFTCIVHEYDYLVLFCACVCVGCIDVICMNDRN